MFFQLSVYKETSFGRYSGKILFSEHFKNLMAYFIFNLQTCKTYTSPEKDFNSTFCRPDLINDVKTKLTDPTNPKKIK